MNASEIVSVVIPTRDRWDLVEVAVASVLRQREVELDVIVVDDGSREQAPRSAALADSRVRHLRHERSRGVANARNTGIEAARGEWIAFLDDDDVWAPDKLSAQLRAAAATGASFAYAGALLVSERTGAVTRADPPPPDRLGELLRGYNAIPAGASNVVAKADLVRSVGGFDPQLAHLADWDMWIRLEAAGSGSACREALVGYRLHAASMRTTVGGALRELRRLDRKHRRSRRPPGRVWVYRWLAEGQLLSGHRSAAVVTYLRGAARCRSRSDLLRAIKCAVTPLSRLADDRDRRAAAVAPGPGELAWLRSYLPHAGASVGTSRATARRVSGRDPDAVRRPGLLARAKAAARVAAAGAAGWALRHTDLRAGLALVYHELGSVRRDPEREVVPVVDPELFRAHLAHLGSRYELVSAGQLPAAIRARRRGDRFPVAITFDDDLRSHVDVAMPTLLEAGCPATFFLTGASLAGPASFWWQDLQRALDAGIEPELEGRDLADPVAAVAALDPAERTAVIDRLTEQLGGEPEPGGLRAADVRRLASAGFEIGFHTREHEILPDLDERELDTAMRAGRNELEAVAGSRLRTIAYPHGRADRRVAEAARAAGFELGYTTEGFAVAVDTDPLLMGRLYPSRASLGHFATQLTKALWRARRVSAASPSPSDSSGPPGPPDSATPPSREAGGGYRSRHDPRAIVRRRLIPKLRGRPPGVGQIRFGDLRRLAPVSREFGFDRGQPIDRYYVEAFLRRHAGSPGYGGGEIRGHVLEVGGDEYVRRFGGWSGAPPAPGSGGVTAVDVLHADASNPAATIVGDLASGEGIPEARYDCVICTQTLHVIYEVEAAVRTLHRMLTPGGVALVTMAGITQACRPDRDLWGDYWRFTTLSARRLFETAFEPDRVRVEAYGNVLASIAFLHGLAAAELRREELELRDPDYELLICVRAQKEGPK